MAANGVAREFFGPVDGPIAIKDLRNPAFKRMSQGNGPGFVIWYDHGAETMQYLHDTYGLEFKTSFARCLKIADEIEEQIIASAQFAPMHADPCDEWRAP